MVGTATVLHPRPQPRHQSSEFNSTRIDGHWRHPRNSGHDGSVTTSHIRPTMSTTISLDEEVRLYSTNAEREKYSTLATLFGIIIALDYLERAYVRDSITAAEWAFLVFWSHLRTERLQYLKRYSPACTRLLSQYKTMLKLLGSDVPSVDEFMKGYRVSSA